jgi:hypothetical protein
MSHDIELEDDILIMGTRALEIKRICPEHTGEVSV